MTTVHLVVNPAAGGGTAGTHADDVEKILLAQGFDVRTTLTRDAAHAVEIARQALPTDVVAPLGGDGMISLVARGLLESGAMLLPLPAGRGNDFIRSLALPRDTAAVASGLRAALSDPTNHLRTIDVGTANGTPFLGVASIGFDAEANARANGFKVLRGPLVYTIAGLFTMARVKRREYDITVDGRPLSVASWNVAVGNSGRHGGGQRVCPTASLTDGKLDFVTFGGTRGTFAAAALLMRSGKHVRMTSVGQAAGKDIAIASAHNDGPTTVTVYADGDAITTLPTQFGIIPAALRVLCPTPVTTSRR